MSLLPEIEGMVIHVVLHLFALSKKPKLTKQWKGLMVVHANAEVWIHEQINDFELLEYVLLLAVKLPLAWPSFRAHGKELTEVLSNIQDWKLEGVTRESNVPAFKLASRVTQEHRFQSYGSWGDPVWLRRILEEEQKRCYLPGNC
ncbi:BnaC04g29470D [Brassica napus]|uniref:BnaC04g29470D protein n=2 Tax=Brassica TaxID=3705 RepID=A0A078H883_BRANA|nr:BnaC04g29470D [Brassica napus]VDD10877.1 unnamed protein product [Brassica oleracea]